MNTLNPHTPDISASMKEPEYRRLVTALKNPTEWTEDFEVFDVFVDLPRFEEGRMVLKREYDQITVRFAKREYRASDWVFIALGDRTGILLSGRDYVLIEERRPLA